MASQIQFFHLGKVRKSWDQPLSVHVRNIWDSRWLEMPTSAFFDGLAVDCNSEKDAVDRYGGKRKNQTAMQNVR
jgi:hypothetical protein